MEMLSESHDPRGIATLTLDRPARFNALVPALIDALNAALERAAADGEVRVVVLAGAGRMFCAGADVSYLRKAGALSPDDNLAGARVYSRTTELIRAMGKPVIARVQGGAFGGGITILAARDVVVAEAGASFAITEARFGLTPSLMLPYLIARIGPHRARRWCLTAESMDAATAAAAIGLVDIVAPEDGLDTAVGPLVADLLAGAPGALDETKDWLNRLARPAADAAAVERTIHAFVAGRASSEEKEGTAAFLEKRKPGWAAG
ncbi:MAG: enoyl-CoA hydratase/isomerase family protein [Alphaproteobacteria bacterium]|nr:enoyl-CoA hydratase/isomerase family protein [Alphaproteobacteria bacterium]